MAEIDIQVLDPAEITLPLNIQQLAFMNRSVAPHLLRTDTSGWSDQEYYILDTILNNWIFQGLRQSMMESPLFDLDTIRVIRSRRYDTSGILKPLKDIQLEKLKTIYPADAVISLEFYGIDDSIRVGYNLDESRYEAYLGIFSTTVWRIYDLTRDTVIDEYVLRKTSDWYAYNEDFQASLDGLPLTADGIRAAAFEVGTRYGTRISPGWMEVVRYYHVSGGREMRDAGKMAGEGDWKGAAEIWEKLAYAEDERIAARACFNMALVCETEDLMVPALDWAIKSFSIRQTTLTRDYIDLLKERYEDRKKLQRQLPSAE